MVKSNIFTSIWFSNARKSHIQKFQVVFCDNIRRDEAIQFWKDSKCRRSTTFFKCLIRERFHFKAHTHINKHTHKYTHTHTYIYIYMHTNSPVNAIVRLPRPRSGDSQGQETFLAPYADKQTHNHDTRVLIPPSLSINPKVKGIEP